MGILFNEEKVVGGDINFGGINVYGKPNTARGYEFLNMEIGKKYLVVINGSYTASTATGKIYNKNGITGATFLKEVENQPYSTSGKADNTSNYYFYSTILIIEATNGVVTIPLLPPSSPCSVNGAIAYELT